MHTKSADQDIEEILHESPWYFGFKALIAERPNTNPVGLGNNNAEVDTSVLMPGLGHGDGPGSLDPVAATEEEPGASGDEESGDEEADGCDAAENTDAVTEETPGLDSVDATTSEGAEYESGESSELDETLLNTDGSVNLAVTKGGKKRTAAGRSASSKVTSQPVEGDPGSTAKATRTNSVKDTTKDQPKKDQPKKDQLKKDQPKKMKLEDKFVAAHAEEEKTRQKAYASKIADAEVRKSKTEFKLEKLRLQAQLAQEKMRHKERMTEMELRLRMASSSGSAFGGPFAGFHSSASPFPSAALNSNTFPQPSGSSQRHEFRQSFTDLGLSFSEAEFDDSSNSGAQGEISSADHSFVQ